MKTTSRMPLVDPPGRLHEDVEPAHRLEAAADVGDDPGGWPDLAIAHATGEARSAVEDIGLDAVEDDGDLVPQLGGEELALEMGGAVARPAVDQVEQDHRVARPHAEEVDLRRGELGAEIHVGAMRMVVILEIVDDRRVGKQFGQEERGAEPAMSDDQVRPELGVGLARLEHAVGVRDRRSRRSGCNSGSTPARRRGLVRDLADSRDLSRRRLGDEGASPAEFLDQVASDVPELRGEVLMDEQDMHRSACPPSSVTMVASNHSGGGPIGPHAVDRRGNPGGAGFGRRSGHTEDPATVKRSDEVATGLAGVVRPSGTAPEWPA